MRRLLGLLGLLAIGGMVTSMAVAYREKMRRAEQPPFDETADEVDLAVIFESIDATSRAGAFRGGDLDLWYGGGKLDLRQATLDPAGADLRIRAIFGGLEIDVPSSWVVDVRGRAFFGGVGGARGASPVDESGPRLVLHVLAVFGGVAIISRRDDEPIDATEVVAIPIQAEPPVVPQS
jgi:hypothetical protein